MCVRPVSRPVNNGGMDFRTNLRRLRKHEQLSQEQLAHACGWTGQSRISNYESGAREPTLADLFVLAKALKVSVSELIGERGEGSASQSGRPDFETMGGAVTVLTKYIAVTGDPQSFLEDPEMLETAYEVVLDFGHPVTATNVVDLAARLGQSLRGQGTGDEQQQQSTVRGTGDALGEAGGRTSGRTAKARA